MHIPQEGQGCLMIKRNNDKSVGKCLNLPPTKARLLALYIWHKPYNKKTRERICYSKIIKIYLKLCKSQRSYVQNNIYLGQFISDFQTISHNLKSCSEIKTL